MIIPKKYRFIVELGRALHIYGIPSYKIQSYLTEVANNKGIKGSFMDFPTWINYAFYDDEESFNYIECIPPGILNLGAFSRVAELTKKVINSEVDSDEISEELSIIHQKTKKVNHFYLTLAYAFAAGAFSLIIGTNWISFWLSLLTGSLVYLMVYLTSKSKYIENVFESLSALLITIISCLIKQVVPEFNVGLTILASIIIFVPGLGITTALEEITSKNLVSGSAKLFDAIILLFKQFFGVLLGFGLMTTLMEVNIVDTTSEMPKWINFFAIPVLSISLFPVLQVRKKDMFFGVLTGAISFSIIILLSGLGILISTFIGTLTVVGISSLFGRISKTPKTVYLIQGIIILVPGSKSFIGLSNSFLNKSAVSSGNVFEEIAFILMGIIGGLLFAGTFRDNSSSRD
ncbi:threonine/serine exporter family protein [Polaribacter vadi]|uniref:threonine/serine ThrE exporter family protein n=1 Tax=Polaribacter TaxID=52959 RepID=UPI001C08B392|nr:MULTISPECIES: threonine/serine exporter family protein [Polaribacter]MBU3012198.1 threonine/serine exporter family protein [Polaribacter vadi]MDO6742014.1 threonine/serine exporter family protein [Polaribacter sp. 1_MG-2023]